MNNIKIIDEEVRFEDVNPNYRPVVSKTDINGIITYANSMFRALSGYKKGEMVGRPHSIIRHPDMPDSVFKDMWQTILLGKSWEGVVKNLRKDGRYYWVNAHVTPIKKQNIIVGFISVRSKVEDSIKKYYENLYKEMRKRELEEIKNTQTLTLQQNILPQLAR